jgi:hypothetical protein
MWFSRIAAVSATTQHLPGYYFVPDRDYDRPLPELTQQGEFPIAVIYYDTVAGNIGHFPRAIVSNAILHRDNLAVARREDMQVVAVVIIVLEPNSNNQIEVAPQDTRGIPVREIECHRQDYGMASYYMTTG